MKIKSVVFILLILMAIVASFVSCTPQQRLNRLLKAHPELVKRDTVFRNDTLIIESNSKDTLFNFSQAKDTVVLKDGRLTVKYFYTRDSVFLQGDCAADTIIKEVPYYINDVRPENAEKDNSHYWWIALIIALFIVFIILIARK